MNQPLSKKKSEYNKIWMTVLKPQIATADKEYSKARNRLASLEIGFQGDTWRYEMDLQEVRKWKIDSNWPLCDIVQNCTSVHYVLIIFSVNRTSPFANICWYFIIFLLFEKISQAQPPRGSHMRSIGFKSEELWWLQQSSSNAAALSTV